MRKRTFLVASICILFCLFQIRNVFAQDFQNFVQFYVNPSLLNPALTGSDGKSSLTFSYKKQWVGIEGAPSVGNVSFQSALPNQVNFGLNINNEQQGLINSSSLLVTGGYTIPLANNNMFRFGFSVGAAWSKLDINALNFGALSPNDPIQVDLMDNNFHLLGNAGISFHSRTFNFGLALPNIMEPVYLTKDAFTVSKINPFESTIIHTSYRFYFSDNFNVFEPYLIYRLNKSLPSQLEAAGILHLQHKVWIGGSYKQDFGISALGGFKVNNQLGVGYSYSLKNTGLNEMNKPSHEIHISLLFGERRKNMPYYSFVDTEIEKHPKNYKALVARQKQKERDLAKRHAADLAKKEEQEKKEREKAYEKATKVTPVPVAVVPTPTPNPEPTQKHDAGPRMKGEVVKLDFGNTKGVIHDPEEEEMLNRLKVHAENAQQHHGEDFHPNAERHEFVKKGSHPQELNLGDYVIVGSFKSEENALEFSDGLKHLGFSTSNYGFSSEKGTWFVHISQTDDINGARAERDKYRKMLIFRDAWLLTVQP